MPSERIQRRIDRLLDEAEAAADQQDWTAVHRLADEVLGLDAENSDAPSLIAAADRRLAAGGGAAVEGGTSRDAPRPPRTPTIEHPSSFVAGRYAVRRFLGEGGKKVRRDKPA